jgi:hypothetical protein
MPMTKTDGLVEAFKETVQSRIEAGEIEEIDDETLGKLQECLRCAIRVSSRINQQTRGVPLSDSSPNLQPPLVPTFFNIIDNGTTNFLLSDSPSNLQPPLVPNFFTIDNGTTNISPPLRTPSIFTSLPVQQTSIGDSAPLQSNGRNESFSDYMISRLS